MSFAHFFPPQAFELFLPSDFKGSLDIRDIGPSSVIYVVNIFSWFVRCSLTLLMVVFAIQL